MRHAGHLGAAGGAVQPMVIVLMIPRRRVRLMIVRTTLRHRVYMQSPRGRKLASILGSGASL